MKIENHVYGNGEAQPEGRVNFTFKKKNEFKGKAFISTKHVIESATEKTFVTATRYVELYLMLGTETAWDKEVIKSLLKQQFTKLYPNV